MSATQVPIINKQLEEIRDAIIMTSQGQSEEQGWKQIHNMVRAGMGPKLYPIGTQLIVEKETSMSAGIGGSTGITAAAVVEETFLAAEALIGNGIHIFTFNGTAWMYEGHVVSLTTFGISVTGTPVADDEVIITEAYDNIVFDVVEHRDLVDPADGVTKPAMILLMHNVIYSRPFDEPEALIYVPEALEAGTYNVISDDSTPVTYQFTLTNAVAAGSQLVVGSWPSSGYDLTGQSIKVYSGPTSTTVIETASITVGSGGTNLGTFGQGNVNHKSRARYGSNNYKESALRQWINSKAVANSWWKKTNNFDRPSTYANVAGLLHGMDGDFLAAVRPITVVCKTNNTFELSGWTLNTAYTLEDKFFLASRNEVGFGTENVAEGSVFKAYDGAQNVDRIKYDISSQSTARSWWLRSPSPSGANLVRIVSSDGSLYSSIARHGYGAVAACAIY